MRVGPATRRIQWAVRFEKPFCTCRIFSLQTKECSRFCIGFNATWSLRGKVRPYLCEVGRRSRRPPSWKGCLGCLGCLDCLVLPGFRRSYQAHWRTTSTLSSPIDLTKSYSISVQERYIKPLRARLDIQLSEPSHQHGYKCACTLQFGRIP